MSKTCIASAISTPTYLCQSSSSSIIRQPTFYTLSTCINSISNTPNFRLSAWIHRIGLTPFCQWHGLRHLGVSISKHSVRLENKRCKGKGVFASLFGVGAPEAELWLCWFLVQKVARTLGKTLHAFQPTIRELQDVSREFKSTIEREIGLDDFQSPVQNNSSSSTTATNSSPSTIASSEDSQMKVDPNGSPSTNNAYSSEDYLKITKEQLKAAATQQQTASLGENQSEIQIKSQAGIRYCSRSCSSGASTSTQKGDMKPRDWLYFVGKSSPIPTSV